MKRIIQDRKILYLFFCMVCIFLFTLSIAYAAMSAVLEIHGNSEVVASNWDIHLDNVKVSSGSVSANAPSISGNSSVVFDVELNTPGEFYEFTVDVVNNGSIDAMIDSVVKTPELTSEQAKYIKYEITYQNGESISTKQTLKKNTTTPIKVRLEYRKDIVASDLPNSVSELNLKLTLVYVQSDGSGSNIINNGIPQFEILSGTGVNIGDELCIKNECFYVISSTDSTVTMLTKYNLYVGNSYDDENGIVALANPTGKQSSNAIGCFANYSLQNKIIGNVPFSYSDYWKDNVGTYPMYVYNKESILYNYVDEYSKYLWLLGLTQLEARLISYEELESLGCSGENYSCNDSFDWVYKTSYCSGSAADNNDVWCVYSNAYFYDYNFSFGNHFGVRPVITISRDYL